MARRYSSTRSAPRPARWMDLRYAGTCCECGSAVPAGARAFYDPQDRTVTCTELECCRAAGLTEEVWSGGITAGNYRTVRTATRPAGRPGEDSAPHADPFAKTRSRGYYGRDAGRCEDAPCCGCCS